MTEQVQLQPTFIQGGRVVLRPVLREDLPLLVRWLNDPEVTQFITTYLPILEADEASWFDNLPKRKPNDIVLIIVVDGDPIGKIGVHQINWKDRTAMIGTLIGEKKYWDKGYGSVAKMLLLNFAFNTLNLRKICSSAIEYNLRSCSYNLKCGYHEEGRLRRHIYRKGRYWDEILFAVFKKDWLPIWREFRKNGYRFVK